MICARIQHHPARAALLGSLLDRLSPLPTEVIIHSSDPPSPWAGYRLCLTDMPACSHLLVIQDDTAPCANFAPALEQIAATNPEDPVCLFLGPMPQGAVSLARRAMKRNWRYARLLPSPFVPLVAMLWPRHKAEAFMEWVESGVQLPGHPNPRADDAVVAQWMKRTRQMIVVTVPSLVEHLDVPSVKGLRNAPSAWKATLLADDAMEYTW